MELRKFDAIVLKTFNIRFQGAHIQIFLQGVIVELITESETET